jgi:glycosyltransferase involved in cell wall biosynthesis
LVKKDKAPFFSVIIPNYNRKEYFKRAIDSVFSQKFQNFEVIVVDDGSDAETKAFLENILKTQKNTKCFFQKNKGVSAARNFGVSKASSDWICFLDSDDWWDPEKLLCQKKFILENPQYLIFQTREVWIKKGLKVVIPKKHQKVKGDIFARSLQQCFITPSTVCLHKSLFSKNSGFDEDLLACEDYDFWMRITAGHQVGLIEKDLAKRFEGHPCQLSHLYPAMDRFRIYSLWKNILFAKFTSAQKTLAKKILQEKIIIYLQGAKRRKKDTSSFEKLCSELPEFLKNLSDKKIFLQKIKASLSIKDPFYGYSSKS